MIYAHNLPKVSWEPVNHSSVIDGSDLEKLLERL